MGRAFLPVLSAAQLYFTFLQCTIIYKSVQATLRYFTTLPTATVHGGTCFYIIITKKVLVKLATAFFGKLFITGPACLVFMWLGEH